MLYIIKIFEKTKKLSKLLKIRHIQNTKQGDNLNALQIRGLKIIQQLKYRTQLYILYVLQARRRLYNKKKSQP